MPPWMPTSKCNFCRSSARTVTTSCCPLTPKAITSKACSDALSSSLKIEQILRNHRPHLALDLLPGHTSEGRSRLPKENYQDECKTQSPFVCACCLCSIGQRRLLQPFCR